MLDSILMRICTFCNLSEYHQTPKTCTATQTTFAWTSMYHFLHLLRLPLSSAATKIVKANPSITFTTKDQIVNIWKELSSSNVSWLTLKATPQAGHELISALNQAKLPQWHGESTLTYQATDCRPVLISNSRNTHWKFNQVNVNDASIYQCQIAQGASMPQPARTNFFVRIPPTIDDKSTRSEITSGSGNTSRQRAKVEECNKEDRGTYYCGTNNGNSPGAKWGLRSLTQRRTNYTKTSATMSMMECVLSFGHPPNFNTGSIEWQKYCT